jgi:GntR family transcriptional repressor for pyruvate dehydrogenase complex
MAQAQAVIDPVRPTSACELAVEQLRRAIHLGRFVAGDKLPPERALARQLRVSRTTVRDAVKILETDGLVQSKRGAAGGLSVLAQRAGCGPSPAERLKEIEAIYDYRLAIECAAARLAAARRRKPDLAALGRQVGLMGELAASDGRAPDTVSRFMAADSEFHLSIARAARNDYLLAAIEEARAAMFRPIGAVFRRLADNANAYHEALHAAIAAGDAGAAEAAMAAHLTAGREDVERLVLGGS